MGALRRIADFIVVCCTAIVLYVAAFWMWPYLELVSPVGAMLTFILVVSIVDGVWFTVRRRTINTHAAAPQPAAVTAHRQQPAA